jgi:hypothetical protein
LSGNSGNPSLVIPGRRAENGSVDARLGGDLIRQRVARTGGGRSGGFRTLIAYQRARRSVFLYGFAKNERDNIGPKKLGELKLLAKTYMNLSDAELAELVHLTEIREIEYGDREEQ